MTACGLASQAACLPVTALCSILADGAPLLLAGQGPYLHAYNVNGSRISTTRIFEVQPVLGVRIIRGVSGSDPDFCLLLVWGGSLLRLGWWTIQRIPGEPCNEIPNLHLAEQRSCRDWILDAVFHDHGILVLTAHNQLLKVPVVDAENPAARGKTLTIHGPRSFLYSGCISVAGPSSVVIASGTVFGEILVWTCDRKIGDPHLVPSLRHVFKGHTGSVFGVSVSQAFDMGGNSQRVLTSCSDDRTVRLWDISDCGQNDQEAARAITSSQTGFGHANEADETHIASAWGHMSRIWDVEFVWVSSSSANQDLRLLSRGEDGACQLWTVKLRRDHQAEANITAILQPDSCDRYHFGKNAWSLCQLSDDQGLVIFTGGADGQIVSRRFDNLHTTNPLSFTLTAPLKEITATPVALKHYQLLNDNECLATTDRGHLFRLTIKNGRLLPHQICGTLQPRGLKLCYVEGCALALSAQQTGGLHALLDGQDSLTLVPCELASGILWIKVAGLHTTSPQASTMCVVAVLANIDAVILWLHIREGSIQTGQTSLRLPDTFTITTCHYDQSTKVLLIGSRAGALAVYSNVTPESTASAPPYCLRHIHGTDTVTSVSVIRRDVRVATAQIKKIYVLTSGRDGNYAIHRLEWPFSPEGIQPQVFLVHLSSPPFGPNIEGAYFTGVESSDPSDEQDLILYGFRSTSFVVWNETQQSEVLSVECGGSHRSWSFNGGAGSPASSYAHSFVWTQAGKFNWHNNHGSSHRVVQRGGHGREIKAVASIPLPYDTSEKQGDRVLVATGAEDTKIQIFVFTGKTTSTTSPKSAPIQPDNHVAFASVATLKRHTTGLQHVQFSPSTQYLFSSAGCEEFYVWKLSFDVPDVGVGAVLWDIMPTEEDDSDSRIMSFDLCSVDRRDNQNSQEYTVVMMYSSGKSKIVRYTTSSARNQGTFEKLREINYGTFCLTQAFFLLSSSVEAIPNHIRVLSAGTNGYLNISLVNRYDTSDRTITASDPQPQSSMEAYRVHQSSILAMDIISFSSTMHLVATGGDDNALGLTLLPSSSHLSLGPEAQNGMPERPQTYFRTISIPSAHAAAITALTIKTLGHGANCMSAMVITVSNDQRVKVWRVGIDLAAVAIAEAYQDKLFEALQVKLVGSTWTSVADASGIAIIGEDVRYGAREGDRSNWNNRGEIGVLVVGVGMEQLSIKWDGDQG